MEFRARAAGHWWTIAPNLLGRVWPTEVRDRSWRTQLNGHLPSKTLHDRDRPLALVGAYASPAPTAPRDLYLFVHGLGGSDQSPYLLAAAHATQARGLATLRVSMRGAGRSDPGCYHAGLGADLSAVLADPSLALFSRVFIVGFSLGGHMALRVASDPERDPRIAAVAAVCAPLDLAASARAIDHPRAWVYRRHLLNGLESGYAAMHGQARHFDTIRAWDEAVVVPYWGFESAEQYWQTQSMGPRLRELMVPTLFVGAPADPMIPVATLMPHLERAARCTNLPLTVAWARRGGHVGFPADLDLGQPGALGLMPQLHAWFDTQPSP